MSGYFSDNQTKQKAYDRYYNAMARSDFIQGRKLKALIEKESIDDATTDNLAALFQKAMAKSRDYEYDEITKKIRQKTPPVLIGEHGAPTKSSAKKGKSPIKVNIGGKKGKSPIKVIPRSPDVEMKSAVPLTPSPSKSEVNMVTPPRKRRNSSPEQKQATPLQRRLSLPKNFESPTNWKPSVAPNILSPRSMAAHRARVMEEDVANASMARLPKVSDDESKYFQDFFGTGRVTKADEEAAAAKIDENGDMEEIRKVINKMARERMSATAGNSRTIGSRKFKAAQDSNKKTIIRTVSKMKYLSKKEKAATAKEMNAIVEEVYEAPKRKRIPTPDDKTPTDSRELKVRVASSTPSPKRNLVADFDEAKSDRSNSFDDEIEEEIRQSKHNAEQREKAAKIIGKAKTPTQVRSNIKKEFGKEISKMIAGREGRAVDPSKQYEWFDLEIRKPAKGETLADYRNYVAGMLSGIYMVR